MLLCVLEHLSSFFVHSEGKPSLVLAKYMTLEGAKTFFNDLENCSRYGYISSEVKITHPIN